MSEREEEDVGPSDVTTLIAAARSGERSASEALYDRVYSELKRLARVQLSVHGRPGQTLDTTALVPGNFKALLDLQSNKDLAAIPALRTELRKAVAQVDSGRGMLKATLGLDVSPDLARLVELRFFAGLSLEEIAPIVERSERSLKRDWRRAQAFLRAALEGKAIAPEPAS